MQLGCAVLERRADEVVLEAEAGLVRRSLSLRERVRVRAVCLGGPVYHAQSASSPSVVGLIPDPAGSRIGFTGSCSWESRRSPKPLYGVQILAILLIAK
jgi:hypothetical protein